MQQVFEVAHVISLKTKIKIQLQSYEKIRHYKANHNNNCSMILHCTIHNTDESTDRKMYQDEEATASYQVEKKGANFYRF